MADNLVLPTVTQDQILQFHTSHFSQIAITTFSRSFQTQTIPTTDTNSPEDSKLYEVEEEEDLGYYPDGVKRTLTDQQIAMFRHSEEESIRRTERRKLDAEKQRIEFQLLDDDYKLGDTKESDADNREDVGIDMEYESLVASTVSTSENISPLKVTDSSQTIGIEGTGDTPPASKTIEKLDKRSGKTFIWPAIFKMS